MQLSLFQQETQEPKINYWEKFFNWKPIVGQQAIINTTIEYCITLRETVYCYCMSVIVKSIEGDMALCETTKEWEYACTHEAKECCPCNKSGNIYRVNINNLAPIMK